MALIDSLYFLCGGSIGLYVYGYCIYYYYAKSDWSDSLQVSFFGYMACICYGLFMMFGTVGFVASLMCVRATCTVILSLTSGSEG
ncbi:Nonaspanin [Parasponia andersonii]|uniref:Transmembrane 9 superfamily member n=1 Tax=Parasponia andersonii TaxID=3476 RepID=A0A2P5E127_PARAD|nr:Nonaspanin [Parasponia andersonii]